MIVNPEGVTRLPFTDESFDAVFSIGVLEHVRETGGDEVDSLKEIKRVLKKDGYFICTHLPNKFSWIEFLTSFMKSKHHHEYKYSKSDIKRIVELSGFNLIETKALLLAEWVGIFETC